MRRPPYPGVGVDIHVGMQVGMQVGNLTSAL
jgi:hypothetical protein